MPVKSRVAAMMALLLGVSTPGVAAPSHEYLNPEIASGFTTRQAVTGQGYMVATANPLATQAGFEVLQAGGSAVDAAIAAQLVLGLTEPQSSGVGGGGFLVHYAADNGQLRVYDSRETAPAAARSDRFLRDGRPLPFEQAVDNGLSVGTPGLLRGLELAHRQHGVLPWRSLFQPAIELAKSGFEVSPRLHAQIVQSREALAAQPAAARYFLDENGQPWPVGHVLKNPDYAVVLTRVADQGADAFYTGDIARDIVAAVRAHPSPGDLSVEDLATYRAQVRDAVCGDYRAYRICGAPPPSSGPLAILQMLGILEHYPMGQLGPRSAQAWHYFTEAGRLAFADRGLYVADPAFVDVPMNEMLAPAYLAQRASLIQLGRSMGTARPGDPGKLISKRAAGDALEVPSTTHVVVADARGNVLSMTNSIESAFGSKIFVRGFLLNNELTDFSLSPEDSQGRLVANRVEPGKRPRSSMAPIIVFRDGRPYLAVGSPGGSAIINYVAKTLVGVLDWDLDIQQAIALPNIGSRNQATEVEKGSALTELGRLLQGLGHEVKFIDFPSGIQGIVMEDSVLTGGADPRREGLVLAPPAAPREPPAAAAAP
ncbi:gamma-glutamyltransferase [Bordetella sp. 15P40C-2]|uniref:gamma-glutamyltransferase n=1 Tax=Bordetella sp. 15P40C-2 TaxID=2572246 RepID=UPI001328A0B7|nr:gamma-glutamyltransferase [Bordetella sp. 15P40C-2]MVW70103.1 gamma-glutamyltransferase [Bordetella sp. 15P40C-2]